MKRQARPFVIETKRSRKAPTNLWASTPMLQQELAAVSAAESNAESVFTDKSAKERAAEPVRRILQSLIVEEKPLEVEVEEEPSPRRRAVREPQDGAAAPARRGRPRRAVVETVADSEAGTLAADTPSKTVSLKPTTAASSATASETTAKRRASGTFDAPSEAAPAKRVSRKKPGRPPSAFVMSESDDDETDAAVETVQAVEPRPSGRSRAVRNPAAAALLPGERWKRRLPQLLR